MENTPPEPLCTYIFTTFVKAPPPRFFNSASFSNARSFFVPFIIPASIDLKLLFFRRFFDGGVFSPSTCSSATFSSSMALFRVLLVNSCRVTSLLGMFSCWSGAHATDCDDDPPPCFCCCACQHLEQHPPDASCPKNPQPALHKRGSDGVLAVV